MKIEWTGENAENTEKGRPGSLDYFRIGEQVTWEQVFRFPLDEDDQQSSTKKNASFQSKYELPEGPLSGVD